MKTCTNSRRGDNHWLLNGFKELKDQNNDSEDNDTI